MPTLRSSPERLADPAALSVLRALLLHHGALGYRVRAAVPNDETTFLAVPLVFGLLPARSLAPRQGGFTPMKPIIREHLRNLGVTPDDELLSLLKSVADQWAATIPGLLRRRRR